MNIPALKEIGEIILDTEYNNSKYPDGSFTTPSTLDDPDLELVMRIKFQLNGGEATVDDESTIDSVTFFGTEFRELEGFIETAERHMYAHRDNAVDYSFSRRVTSNSYTKRFNALTKWVSNAVSDAESGEYPLLDAVQAELTNPLQELRCELRKNDADGDEKALLAPVFIEPDGTERYLGEIESIRTLTREAVANGFSSSSGAKRAHGDGVCCACDDETTVYGLGANNIGAGRFLPFKQQSPFPDFTASNAWRSRPLCAECIPKITIGLNGFVDAQAFGLPQIRCRLTPYTIQGSGEALQEFVTTFRHNLPDSDTSLDDEEVESKRSEAFITALREYRTRVDVLDEDDSLRFNVLFYQQNKSQIKGIHSVDGVSYLGVHDFKDTYARAFENSPVQQSEGVRSKLYSEDDSPDYGQKFTPTERQLLSGYWFYLLFFNNRNRDGGGSSTPDPGSWRELFEGVIVNQRVPYDLVIREAIRDLQTNRGETFSWGYYLKSFLRVHYFLESCDKSGILVGAGEHGYATMNGLNETYSSYGDAVESVLEQNPSISQYPGRKSAFILGVLASRLSAWQQRRGVNRTFIGTHEITQLKPDNAPEWVTSIWDKALTYNQQENNGGVPWKDVYNAFHAAHAAHGDEQTHISTEEYRYYYIQGVNIGSSLKVDRDADTGSDNLEVEPVA